PVRAESCHVDRPGVSLAVRTKAADDLTGLHIPKNQRLISRARQNGTSIRAEHDAYYFDIGSAVFRAGTKNNLAGLEIPEDRNATRASRGGHLSIRADGYSPDLALIHKAADDLTGLHIPKNHRLVCRARQNGASVGAERDADYF